jgi:NDP-sugar pyrophosphorylase family protein
MKAMILAAGLGERMRPLTADRAKPSLPLLNRTVIAQTLQLLRLHGVTEAVINLHYEPESIRGIVGDGRRHGIKVHYSEEPIILGTAGGLKKAEPYLKGGGPFFMINSDCVSDCDLTAALKKHKESQAIATMVLMPPVSGADYGVVEVGERDRIQRIAGRPDGEAAPGASLYHFAGIHVLEQEIFDAIPAKGKVEINSEVYPGLIRGGKSIKSFVHSGFWRELGTPRLYLAGVLSFLKEIQDPQMQGLKTGEGIYLDKATLPAEGSFEPPLYIGRGTTIGAGASLLGGVAIGRQASVGRNCSIRSSIVWDGARIGDGARLSDCVVTSGAAVPPDVSLSGKIFLKAEGYHGKRDRLERIGSCWIANL